MLSAMHAECHLWRMSFMVSVIILNVNMLSVIYGECVIMLGVIYGEGHYPRGIMLSVTILSGIMLSVIYVEYHYAEYHYGECHLC
jgi:hypothetical protein